MNKYKVIGIILSFLAGMFIALKLLGKITWGWVWVLSPLWIPVVMIFGFFTMIIMIAVFKE